MPGSGTLVLTAFNDYSGGTNLTGSGTVLLGSDQALGTGTVTWNSGTLSANASRSVSNAVTFAGNGTVGGTSDINFNSGAWTLTNGNHTLTVSGAGIATINSQIGETVPGAGLTKAGTGTLVLSNTNTYSGNTTIAAGTLSVGDTSFLGSATNTIAFTGGKLVTTAALNSATRNVTVNGGGGTLDDTGNNTSFANVDGTSGFTKLGGGVLTVNRIRSGNLTVSAGSVVMNPDSSFNGVSHVKALNLATKLDLAANKLITTSATGTWDGSVYTGVTGLVATGKGNSNLWDGATGIVTTQSDAVGSNFTSIGVAQASDVRPNTVSETALWAGQTITGTDTLVMYTYGGDANLDGKINILDYVRIDQGIAAQLTGWSNGDFNYDGKINVLDYAPIIDSNINTQGAAFPTAGGIGGGPSGISAVPEPASTGIVSAAAFLLIRRRRRPQVIRG
jgi:autotransporter-associated beta strand protein